MAGRFFSVRDIVLCSLFAAALCVVSPFTLPIGPVPLSLCNFAVMTAACVLGGVRGTVSAAVFVAAGIIGLPVFGGGMSGIGHILSPTGGFVLSYIPSAALSGAFSTLGQSRRQGFLLSLTGCFLSVIFGYIMGAVWFAVSSNVPFSGELLSICVLPFLPFDAIKCVGAVLFSRLIWSRLRTELSKNSRKV